MVLVRVILSIVSSTLILFHKYCVIQSIKLLSFIEPILISYQLEVLHYYSSLFSIHHSFHVMFSSSVLTSHVSSECSQYLISLGMSYTVLNKNFNNISWCKPQWLSYKIAFFFCYLVHFACLCSLISCGMGNIYLQIDAQSLHVNTLGDTETSTLKSKYVHMYQ